MEFLENTFQAFADFGSGSSKTVLSGQLNVQKFNKLCKDTKIHGDGITSTDTDIIFAKVKGKTDRTINFDQFCEALCLIAQKRYPNKDQDAANTALIHVIRQSGGIPGLRATMGSNDAITQKLTDTSKYTGTHKNRFDETGKGLGKEGRHDKYEGVTKFGLEKITNRKPADVRGVQH